MRRVSLIILLIAVPFLVKAATFKSVQNGDWNDASTWTIGAGAGGTEGVDYPSATDIVIIDHYVIIDTPNDGSNFSFSGQLTINFGDTLESQVGDNIAGFVLEGNGLMRNNGSFFTLDAAEEPDETAHVPYEFVCKGNSVFIGGLNSFAFISDDWNIQENARIFIDNLLCYSVSDDVIFDGTSCFMYGTGNIRIGGDGASSNAEFVSGATVAQLDDDITIWRNVATTNCSGTSIATGTNASTPPPFAFDDSYTTALNSVQNQNVLYNGTSDFSPTSGDTITLSDAGSNAGATNGSTSQGGTVSVNNNGTISDLTDDYIVYTPPTGFVGTDTYNYLITNEGAATDIAVVTVTITACGTGFVEDTTLVAVVSQSDDAGVNNPANITGAPDAAFTEWYTGGDILHVDFGQIYTIGVQYKITWRVRSGSTNAQPVIRESTINGSFTTVGTAYTIADNTTQETIVTSENDFRFLQITKDNGVNATDFEIDAIEVLDISCLSDCDNDGIDDATDIDDDNDGILDTAEASLSFNSLLNYEFYDGEPSGNSVDNIPTTGALATGTVGDFDVDALQSSADPGDADDFGIRYTGFIFISTGGTYTFYTSSDDGSKLFIDGGEVVDNDGDHGVQERSGSIALSSGAHSITVLFYEDGGGESLSVSYEGPSISKSTLPFAILSDGTTASADTDNDGLDNSCDLDSDGDGIPDIIEAGGIDEDRNGLADVLTDTDGDGWVNLFDSDDGGTALTDDDTDGDALQNRVDIDADGDGIVDYIEAQASTSTPIAPVGTDTDGDGIDNAFDSDLGNSFLVPVNTDGTDGGDYIDTDSDNDGLSDALEAYDTDTDGTANTVPSTTDTDEDGLDDNYDDVVGPNSSTNVTNGGQDSDAFPNLDETSTDERDWREFADKDLDGIGDGADLDLDNDGILNEDEGGFTTGVLNYEFYDGAPSGPSVDNIPTSGALETGTTSAFDVDALQTAADPGDANTYSIRFSGTIFIASAGTYTFYTSSDDGSNLSIDGTEVVDNDFLQANTERSGMVVLTSGYHTIEVLYFENTGDDILTVSYESAAITKTALPFSILSIANGTQDTDIDGIDNECDLDSDNDGIADIIEAGGIDTDGDGRVDDNTDTDGDGYADTFDSDDGGTALGDADTDGDGLQNRIDIDADNDGITDNVEARLTANGTVPSGVDTDNDGWDNSYDATDGGTAITLSNIDGGDPDYIDDDSDGDGFRDWIEGFDDDEDGDALNDLEIRADNFEAVAGNPMYYINTDDADADNIPDWLEDDDADNLPNFLDSDNVLYQDTDGDGLVDLFDTDNNGVASNTPDNDGDGEYDFRDTDDEISLPVELVNFLAIKENQQVKLSWETATEINNHYFIIERATDGRLFVPIYREQGNGTTVLEKNYSAIDTNPFEGANYYRLAQVDFDGKKRVYNEYIRFVNFERYNILFDVFPNPSNGRNLKLRLYDAQEGMYNIEIYSIKGQLLLYKKLKISSEQKTFEVDLLKTQLFISGIYSIKISSQHGVYNKLFIVK